MSALPGTIPWNKGRSRNRRHDELLGAVRLCSRCDEEWPDDAEFFYRTEPNCKACVLEQQAERKQRRAA